MGSLCSALTLFNDAVSSAKRGQLRAVKWKGKCRGLDPLPSSRTNLRIPVALQNANYILG